MKAGAFDYIPKPFDPDELVLAVQRATDWRELRLQNARLRTEASARAHHRRREPGDEARDGRRRARRAQGRDGAAHGRERRRQGRPRERRSTRTRAAPTSRSCASTPRPSPSELAEAELFGHTKGAFTGAQAARLGYFQQANKGTLFIDEIGELPLAIQAKVLRALQSGEVQQVGGRPEIVDVRLVAATNRDLAADVKAGRFREDLFYRLNVVPIRVPPLRERPEDVEPLVRTFVRPVRASATAWAASRSSRRSSRRCGRTRGRATCASSRTPSRACSRSRPTSGSRSRSGGRSPRGRATSSAAPSAAGDPGPGPPAARARRGVRARAHRRGVRGGGPQPERDRAAPRRVAPRAHREAAQVRAHRAMTPPAGVCARFVAARSGGAARARPRAAGDRGRMRVVSLGPVDDRGALRHRRGRPRRRALALLRLAARGHELPAVGRHRARRRGDPRSCGPTSSSGPRASGRRRSRRRCTRTASRRGSRRRSRRSTGVDALLARRSASAPGTRTDAARVAAASHAREGAVERAVAGEPRPRVLLVVRTRAGRRRRARRASPTRCSGARARTNVVADGGAWPRSASSASSSSTRT